MKMILLLLAVIAVCSFAARASDAATPQEPEPADSANEGSGSLICNIAVPTQEWNRPGPIELSATVENRSHTEVNVQVVPSLILRPPVPAKEPLRTELSYQALWDLEKGRALPVSATVPLRLKGGDLKKIAHDISKLLWSRNNSALLPHSSLFNAVPAGKYSLSLELNGNEGKILCSSNVIEVLIK
ncbi:MAG TPA: hypothetical protein VN911_18265 [Candidatus Acidoferrum sp.]|nr:hypothetical protein [Candidatus Acidoferrum sp.]